MHTPVKVTCLIHCEALMGWRRLCTDSLASLAVQKKVIAWHKKRRWERLCTVFPFASWPPLSPWVTGLLLYWVSSLTAKCTEPRTPNHMLRSSVLPWCRFSGNLQSSHQKSTWQDQSGSDTYHIAHLQGLEMVLSLTAKALIAKRCLCPPVWKDKGPWGWGESQPFLAIVFQDKGQLVQGNREP